MKVVILAGGLGTRLAEETIVRPKPMVEIGGRPILWHIMKLYGAWGFHDFIICLGYKGYMIKEYFANYVLHNADFTVDLAANAITMHAKTTDPWRVTLVDTGDKTMTGGRIKRVAPYVDGKRFCCTYGDGLSDVNMPELVRFHLDQKRKATVTAVQPPGRYGALDIEGGRVQSFAEKPLGDNAWINGGFFVLEPEVLDLIADDATIFETGPLEALARSGELTAYRHGGFWQPMDTLREKQMLEALWESGRAPWKLWD
ncbi:MAG: glucose-1-phosphate cytidylyltransferase [bacterium]|nr:glucose-1-phosphate cytidylyltransferase [bacterium]